MSQVTLALSGLLWDRAVDSIGVDHPGMGLSRFTGSRWAYRRVGFGGTYTVAVDRETAADILDYLDAIASLDGSGMDPDGAADTRKEAAAARRAVASLRRQLDA